MSRERQHEIARILAQHNSRSRVGSTVGGNNRNIVSGRAIIGAEEIEAIVQEQYRLGSKMPSRDVMDRAVAEEVARRYAANVPITTEKRVDYRRQIVGVRSPATIANGASATFEVNVIWDTKPVFLVGPGPADAATVAAFRITRFDIQGRSQLPGGGAILVNTLQGIAPVALSLDTIPQNGRATFTVENYGAATGFFELSMYADVLVES